MAAAHWGSQLRCAEVRWVTHVDNNTLWEGFLWEGKGVQAVWAVDVDAEKQGEWRATCVRSDDGFSRARHRRVKGENGDEAHGKPQKRVHKIPLRWFWRMSSKAEVCVRGE